MKKTKQIGIWMDHSDAFLMELTKDKIITNRVVSESSHQSKEDSWDRHEKLIHKKEQHQQSGYYKKISDIIKGYQEVILFGPTNAKNELFNLLIIDHLFENIKIEVLSSDKMTENQMHAFIRKYFK